MHKALEHYLADFVTLLHQAGIEAVQRKEIPYGIQLELSRGPARLLLNLYYSDKKGLSKVINQGADPALAQAVKPLLNLAETPSPAPPPMHQWKSWIGSDECGKGDYFGALVVCAFALREGDLPRLQELGVCDSKRLNNAQINSIAKRAFALFPNQSYAIIMRPSVYNRSYQGFKDEGKNLNDLLAWQHATAISELYKSSPKSEGVLVDQFSKSQKVAGLLKKKLPLLPVIERTGAEADPAVAMASIMARFHFLQTHAELSKRYKQELPLGSGHNIFAAGETFIQNYGFERLNEVAKLHFISTAKLQQRNIKID